MKLMSPMTLTLADRQILALQLLTIPGFTPNIPSNCHLPLNADWRLADIIIEGTLTSPRRHVCVV
jgi:hypothetical protein